MRLRSNKVIGMESRAVNNDMIDAIAIDGVKRDPCSQFSAVVFLLMGVALSVSYCVKACSF
jgi:hypothetical protein